MSAYRLDWSAVLSGQPLIWLESGLRLTVNLFVWSSLLATLIAILLLALRLTPSRSLQGLSAAYVTLFRNTPLAVQLLFWYFGGLQLLPQPVHDWLNNAHSLGGVRFPSTETLVGIWSLGLFTAAFLTEEMRAGVRAVASGQVEAARSQGFSHWQSLRLIVLPQALRHAWQPLIGQYLNLMKNSPLTMSIAVTELLYQTNQIESYNLHAIEAYAVATVIYLTLGLVISLLLQRLGWLMFTPGVRHAE
jgi:polar amino acid transport system permease protein